MFPKRLIECGEIRIGSSWKVGFVDRVRLIGGARVSLVTVAAVFLSNLPEGLSSASGMKLADRSAAYVFGVWGVIPLVSGISVVAGYVLFRHTGTAAVAATMGVAAGAVLAMIVDSMVPESFEETRSLAGVVTATGFVVAFALSRWAE
jgi:zinc transporter, ZIP family